MKIGYVVVGMGWGGKGVSVSWLATAAEGLVHLRWKEGGERARIRPFREKLQCQLFNNLSTIARYLDSNERKLLIPCSSLITYWWNILSIISPLVR